MKKNLSRRDITQLFKNYCQHQEKYAKEWRLGEWSWKYCSDCILRDIEYYVPHTTFNYVRDVCFAIWHDHMISLTAKNYFAKLKSSVFKR